MILRTPREPSRYCLGGRCFMASKHAIENNAMPDRPSQESSP